MWGKCKTKDAYKKVTYKICMDKIVRLSLARNVGILKPIDFSPVTANKTNA